MKHDFATIIKASLREEAPAGLEDAVIERVALARRARERRRFIAVAAVAAAALVALVFAFRFMAGQSAATGFGQYLSMAFSDRDVLLSSWQDFALLLAGSLPLLGVAAVLSSLAVLLGAARAAARAASGAFPWLGSRARLA